METLSSHRSTDERRSYLSEKERKKLEIKELLESMALFAQELVHGEAQSVRNFCTKHKAVYLNTALCTGVSGATLAVLSRDQLSPIFYKMVFRLIC